MSPISQSDGHDSFGLIDELVPGLATGLDDYDAIVNACCKAWNDLLAMPDRLASITRRKWAKVS